MNRNALQTVSACLLLAASVTSETDAEPVGRGGNKVEPEASSNEPGSRGRPRYPSGPAGPGSFGAYYTRLKYSPDWDGPWRVGPHADVVVRFDRFGCRFVFWRGLSYCPCWVTENGIWYSNQWWETSEMRDQHGKLVGQSHREDATQGGCEPLFDRQARYSHVRIIESHDARVVIHWRYALCDAEYRLPYVDPVTGWGDWADEYYTIYPDGTCIRKMTCWSWRPHGGWEGKPAEGLAHRECQEAIVVNQPGTKPDDNIQQAAVTLANLQEESHTYVWSKGAPAFDKVANPCIQLINLKARYKPFAVVDPKGAVIQPFASYANTRHAPGSNFLCWYHWPVVLDKGDVSTTVDYSRPSHTSLSHVIWPPCEKSANSITKLMLNGMTDRSVIEVARLAKSWVRAAELTLACEGFTSRGYDRAERAYVLASTGNGNASALEFTLRTTDDSPLYNPVFIVENWGDATAVLKIHGKPVSRGPDFRLGHRRRLEGTDLIVWVKAQSVKPLHVELTPAKN